MQWEIQVVTKTNKKKYVSVPILNFVENKEEESTSISRIVKSRQKWRCKEFIITFIADRDATDQPISIARLLSISKQIPKRLFKNAFQTSDNRYQKMFWCKVPCNNKTFVFYRKTMTQKFKKIRKLTFCLHVKME